MIFYKLKKISSVFSAAIGGQAPNLVNETGSIVSYTSLFPPNVIPELFNPESKKYCMYNISDTTNAGKYKATRIQYLHEVNDGGTLYSFTIYFVLPLNIPFRIYLTRETWNNEVYKLLNPNLPTEIVPLSTIQAWNLNTVVSSSYFSFIGSNSGTTIHEAFSVYEYEQ
jgi:hypothetical protein